MGRKTFYAPMDMDLGSGGLGMGHTQKQQRRLKSKFCRTLRAQFVNIMNQKETKDRVLRALVFAAAALRQFWTTTNLVEAFGVNGRSVGQSVEINPKVYVNGSPNARGRGAIGNYARTTRAYGIHSVVVAAAELNSTKTGALARSPWETHRSPNLNPK